MYNGNTLVWFWFDGTRWISRTVSESHQGTADFQVGSRTAADPDTTHHRRFTCILRMLIGLYRNNRCECFDIHWMPPVCGALFRGQGRKKRRGGDKHISGEKSMAVCVCVCVCMQEQMWFCAVGNCCLLIPTLVIYERGLERYNDWVRESNICIMYM